MPKLSTKLKRYFGLRFIKYLIGGSVYFSVGYSIFAICYSGFKWNWFWSKVVGDVIGWSCGYLVQRFWAFADKIHLSEMEHAGRYAFIETIGFIMDYALIGGLNAIGVTPYIGMFISGLFFTFWSFFWYKTWVFPETAGHKSRRPNS